MHRLLILVTLFMLLTPSLAEEQTAADVPLSLPAATSAEEVQQFLLLPTEDGLAGVEKGYIRYISQNEKRDESFRSEYWLGGEEGSILDLNLKELDGHQFTYHTGLMCTRAVYSMALSYLGIDITPGGMSALMNTRNLDDPYDEISPMLGVERITEKSHVFNTMMENYMTDDSYSPVYLYFLRPNGTTHAVLVVATIPDKGRFLVVDPNPPQANGVLYPVYFISLNKARTKIINSTFWDQLKGSQVLQLYQWRLTDDATVSAE